MILMSKYKGQHGGRKGKKILAGVSPPFRAMPERKHFFIGVRPFTSNFTTTSGLLS